MKTVAFFLLAPFDAKSELDFNENGLQHVEEERGNSAKQRQQNKNTSFLSDLFDVDVVVTDGKPAFVVCSWPFSDESTGTFSRPISVVVWT